MLACAAHPGVGTLFGARGHGFRLGPVLDEERVQALEADLGTGLAASYRSFLRKVGAGGAGPDYGLMTPTPGDAGRQWLGIGLVCPAQPTTAEFTGRPFVAGQLRGEREALEEREPTADGFAPYDGFRRAHAAWHARWEELHDVEEAGAVYLVEQGCGYASLLVMTGPRRGGIWEDLRAVDRGIEPTGLAFAQWYVRWIERTEHKLAS